MGLLGPRGGGDAGPVSRISWPISSLPCFLLLESGATRLLPALSLCSLSFLRE